MRPMAGAQQKGRQYGGVGDGGMGGERDHNADGVMDNGQRRECQGGADQVLGSMMRTVA